MSKATTEENKVEDLPENTKENTKEKKEKKEKKKKLSKEERSAQREEQSSKNKPKLKHPDDGDFGDLILNQSHYRTDRQWHEIHTIDAKMNGKQIWIRARVHTNRDKGGVCFLLLRRGFAKIQASLFTSKEIPKEMIKYASGISSESIVDVFGTIKACDPDKYIKTATQQDVELIVQRIYTIAPNLESRLPFEIEDASRSEQEILEIEKTDKKFARVGTNIKLDNRWIDLRTIANHAIFRIQSAVCQFFRQYLIDQGFIEIHSPKIISGASEGGANVFRLNYFGKEACLAQSPQLYKQMALCGDLHRVFEIAPVFRAENSNTHRHLCEFTGLDLEMEFKEHYHEVITLIGNMFIFIFNCLNKYYSHEIEAVRKQYPFDNLMYDKEMLILTHKEATILIKNEYDRLIANNQNKEAEELQIGDLIDFSTPSEKCLGRLVKDKYKTEFYAVDKYPLAARPFYTMPDPYNPKLSNSYDFFLRGEEIMSGAQRVHDPKLLTERANAHKIPLNTIQPYIDSFKYGTSPHGGGGVGLERVVMLFLGLDNIRKSCFFPRDPQRCEP